MVTTFLLWSLNDEDVVLAFFSAGFVVVAVDGFFFLATAFFALTGTSFLGSTTFLRLPAMMEMRMV